MVSAFGRDFNVFLCLLFPAVCTVGYSGMTSIVSHVDRLAVSLRSVRNEEKAKNMTGYLKGKFPCLGIQKPERDKIQKPWFKELNRHDRPNHWEVASRLWEMDHREYQYVAIDYLRAVPANAYEKDDYQKIEDLIVTKSWWDTVDHLASSVAGPYFQTCPDMIDPVISKWRNSDNMWLNRTCLLFQLKYKHKTDFELLKGLVVQYMPVEEFFIQKAIGWSLRHYSRTEPDAVRSFVHNLDLSTVAKREAYKYI
eukprot:scaffold1262_cov106-Cylindrotheca_fusiformis.AAC.3